MFWSKAEKWVESEATAVVPWPQMPRVAGGEGGVRERAGGIPARLDGDVAAADVAQVVLAVRWSPAATARIPVFVP